MAGRRGAGGALPGRRPDRDTVYDGFAPVAVPDRERAACAPHEVDLGRTVHPHRFFEDLTVGFSAGRASPASCAARRYAEPTGPTPHAREFHFP